MPNVIKATNLTVTKAFGKFFIAQDVFKKTDGSEGKLNYKVWFTSPVSEGQVVDVVGNAGWWFLVLCVAYYRKHDK